MNKIKTALKMFGIGIKIIIKNKKLMVYPVISAVVLILFCVSSFSFLFISLMKNNPNIVIIQMKIGNNPNIMNIQTEKNSNFLKNLEKSSEWMEAVEAMKQSERRQNIRAEIAKNNSKITPNIVIRTFKELLQSSKPDTSGFRVLYKLGKIRFFIFILGILMIQVSLIYINSAFFSAIIDIFHGKQCSIRESFAKIYPKKWKIVEWAVISILFGWILSLLNSLISKIPYINKWYNLLLSKILIYIAGFAWGIGTFFVIPILITENIGVKDSIKRSVELLKRTWGEQLTGLTLQGVLVSVMMCVVVVSVFVFTFCLCFGPGVHPGIRFSIWTYTLLPVIFTTIGVLFFCYIVMSMFKCTLYLYASEGVVPEYYDKKDIEEAWIVK